MEWDLLSKQQLIEVKNSQREIRWVITGDSESGDHYGPHVLSKRPTKDQLKRIAMKDPDEDGEGPGDFGSYIYLKVSQCVVDSVLDEEA